MAGRSAASGRAGLAFAACLLTTGCGDSLPATQVGVRASPIIGSEPDDTSSSVVALSVRAASGAEGLCNGFVGDAHAVLTAAHCVAPEAVGQGASFSVFLGSDFGDPAQRAAPENEVAIDRVVFDPEFSLGPIGLGTTSPSLSRKCRSRSRRCRWSRSRHSRAWAKRRSWATECP